MGVMSAAPRSPLLRKPQWTEARRYMGTEILAACRKTGKQPETRDTGVTIEAIGA
jgi:putative transposase